VEIKLKKNEVILKQGDKDSKYMYIVIDGELMVTKNVEGSEIICEKLKKGDIFGEVSMILNKERAATIKASSDSVILKSMDKNDFLSEIKRNTDLAWRLLTKFAEQTEKFDNLRSQFMNMSKIL